MTQQSLLRRPATRRALLGGSVAAASLAVTYAALGDKLDLFGGSSTSPMAAGNDEDAIDQESVRVSHLLRRAGFGASRDEHDHYQTIGLKATIDELVNYTQVDDSAAVSMAAALPIDDVNRGNLPLWWLIRMANTKRPLQEKMTLFWHSLLTSQTSVVKDLDLMVRQNEFYRTNAMASFPEILKGISMDPAMMLYLDVNGSQRQAPNENYARELMELFSLGIGNYSEQDIRESARAFTGWTVPRNRTEDTRFSYAEPVFRPERFDPGSKTFLGRTGNFRPDDIVDIIVDQPASAKFITSKLFALLRLPKPGRQDHAALHRRLHEKQQEHRRDGRSDAALGRDVLPPGLPRDRAQSCRVHGGGRQGTGPAVGHCPAHGPGPRAVSHADGPDPLRAAERGRLARRHDLAQQRHHVRAPELP